MGRRELGQGGRSRAGRHLVGRDGWARSQTRRSNDRHHSSGCKSGRRARDRRSGRADALGPIGRPLRFCARSDSRLGGAGGRGVSGGARDLFALSVVNGVSIGRRGRPLAMRSPVSGSRLSHPSRLDLRCNGLGVLVLPYVKYVPSLSGQLSIVPAVSRCCRRKLGRPPVSVRSWQDAVRWAGMPEAPVDEHGQPDSNEYQIGSAREARRMQPITYATAVKGSAQCQFRAGVTSLLARHEPSNRVRGWGRPGFPIHSWPA